MATHRPVVRNVQLTSSSVEYFEATANETKISAAYITNTTGSNDTYTVYIVPSGDTASVDNCVVYSKQVLAGSTDVIPLVGSGLKSGDKIFMSSAAGGRLSPYITGIEF